MNGEVVPVNQSREECDHKDCDGDIDLPTGARARRRAGVRRRRLDGAQWRLNGAHWRPKRALRRLNRFCRLIGHNEIVAVSGSSARIPLPPVSRDLSWWPADGLLQLPKRILIIGAGLV